MSRTVRPASRASILAAIAPNWDATDRLLPDALDSDAPPQIPGSRCRIDPDRGRADARRVDQWPCLEPSAQHQVRRAACIRSGPPPLLRPIPDLRRVDPDEAATPKPEDDVRLIAWR
jgi:hypothetical protein